MHSQKAAQGQLRADLTPYGLHHAIALCASSPYCEIGPAGTIGPDVPGTIPGDVYLESVIGDVYVLN